MTGEPADRALLEARIARDRVELERAVTELRRRAHEAADPRRRVRENPRVFLAVAVFAGLWLGLRAAKRRSLP
jgi:ElaB/YqjD/DUF883 family membrane-anchored ribosome-binding protein